MDLAKRSGRGRREGSSPASVQLARNHWKNPLLFKKIDAWPSVLDSVINNEPRGLGPRASAQLRHGVGSLIFYSSEIRGGS